MPLGLKNQKLACISKIKLRSPIELRFFPIRFHKLFQKTRNNRKTAETKKILSEEHKQNIFRELSIISGTQLI